VEKMKLIKLLIPFIVICVIFNSSIFSSAITNISEFEESQNKSFVGDIHENMNSKSFKITMLYNNELDISDEIVIAEDDFQELIDMLNDLKEYLSGNLVLFWKDLKFDDNEQGEVALKLSAIIEKISKIFPSISKINSRDLLKSLFSLNLRKIPILSIGYGNILIPFYSYKTSIGRIFRPIFINYRFGFSAIFRLSSFVSRGAYNSKLGEHSLISCGFKGLFINLGNTGLLNNKNGMILLVGSSIISPLFD
jgi:hypothetical protein